MRNIVLLVARLAQVANDVVRMEVGDETKQPYANTDVDIRLAEPICVVVREIGRHDKEQPTALHQSVEGVECHSHQHNRYGHLRVATQQQWEDERALEVVDLDNREEYQWYQLGGHSAQVPKYPHRHKYGCLHQYPRHFVWHGEAEFRVVEVAVTSLYKVQSDEYDQCRSRHHSQENVVSRECYHTRLGIKICQIYELLFNRITFLRKKRYEELHIE